MKVLELRRYPVKSMLGVVVDDVELGPGGVDGDRALALVDAETGRVATAKHPRLWRSLLRCSAARDGSAVTITLPDGRTVAAADADGPLSEFLGRPVRLAADRPAGAEVERPDPEDVLAQGVEAEVEAPTLEIAQGTPGGTFVDHSPLHLITTATLEHLGVEALRYRPNVVVATPPGTAPFVENDWLGRELTVGGVRLRVTLPTPRCSVPTLEHGDLPRAPHAVRGPMAENRVEVTGFGVLPCAGAYAEVLDGGTVRTGDAVELR
ncbi:MOSC domain-containing protein [Pseudonocardia petroleophila]|uniref:MOSC domain-containing protein n=1 Tax=Pseudonocardia petroleophila TaxID=37331 RepID=A0A7G7MPU4_9PSEU|nr:MOSC N-terminal beta barrel domain-containing protein [Pseudonocardia petroleophila]QNG54805.1 MOSC domain-containing protein [Pseudonocardia petroleophila]